MAALTCNRPADLDLAGLAAKGFVGVPLIRLPLNVSSAAAPIARSS